MFSIKFQSSLRYLCKLNTFDIFSKIDTRTHSICARLIYRQKIGREVHMIYYFKAIWLRNTLMMKVEGISVGFGSSLEERSRTFYTFF